MRPIWTEEQTLFLKENYENMKTADLLAVLTDKTNDQLRWKAKSFGLKKKVTKSKCDMTWLENFDSPDTCYWWGFITADGCINERQLILSIHERDKEHLQIFCNKCATKLKMVTREQHPWHSEPYTMARASLQDVFTLKRLKEKLKISSRKTYNPIDISVFIEPNRLAYFLAGLIDGDGHIEAREQNRVTKIVIKVHPNWTDAFKKLSRALLDLYGIRSSVKFTKEGWVYLLISEGRHIIRLYDLVDEKVPLMARKWEKLSQMRARCNALNWSRFKEIGVNPSANFFQ